MNIKRLFLWAIVGIIPIAFLSLSGIINLITDWWWFSEVGHKEIFIKSLTAKVALGFGAVVFAAAFLLINFLISVRSKISWYITLPPQLIGQPISLNNREVRKVGIIISLIIALVSGLIVAASWQDVLKFLSATSFGQGDPIFGKDIAFYIFSLPVWKLGLSLIRILTLLSLVGCGMVYVLRGSFNLSGLIAKFTQTGLKLNKQETVPTARIHLSILVALFLVTIAVATYLSLFKLLITQSSGPVFGVGFTDVNVMVPILRVTIFTTILSAILALFYGFSGKLTPLIGAISLYILVGLASVVVPSIFQKLVVAPNELVKETPYIKHNISATQKAFALDKVEKREILAEKALTATDIAANNLTIKNVRLWDRAPLLSTFSQIQEIRTYYEFPSVDNDRYTINGEIRQTMLSLRELASESLPNRSWINERLIFTHGYGMAAGPVNQVTAEGLPVLFVKNLPPKSDVAELNVNRPEIYYGELSNNYVIVKTKAKEFDYPKGEENVFTTYQGDGGVEINSLARRVLYALRFGSLKILLSNDITTDSRILYFRRINERVEKIAPFLAYDRDPYAVIDDGKLYWIIDAYTSSNLYPYSQLISLNGGVVNYIRNSVKIVIDAYNGSVTFYQVDNQDPIINTYAKIFPNTFHPLSELPSSLRRHLRYPEDIFTLQTAIYTIYHMDDPQIFYNKEDQWEIPPITQEVGRESDGKAPTMSPRHLIMKLPGEEKEEFVLMIPFTPRAKDNLSAWMTARSDGENYGKLLVYRFPKQKLVFGPKQVIGRINQDAEISRQISLWDQRGSQVIQGPLLVIPIEESLIYVRPLYLKAETGKIPELKRVIIAYENKIAMEETLETGLIKIFGDETVAERPDRKTLEPASVPTQYLPDHSGLSSGSKTGEASKQELIKRANDAYEAAIRAQKEGDWSRYGEQIRILGEILKQL